MNIVCPVCQSEVEVSQGKRVPYAYCKGCGTRFYFKKGINLEEVKDVNKEIRDKMPTVRGRLLD